MNSFMTSCKQLLTDNNYQSLANKKDISWKKIGKIGNYCQFKHQRCGFTEPTLNCILQHPPQEKKNY